MSENHRGPEAPEAEVPVVECLDGLARITLEELAITHFVKNGTLQNACFTRPRVVADFGEKWSYAHRQVDELPSKKSKKNDGKSAVDMLKKYELHDRTGQPVVNRDESHDRSVRPVVKRDTRHELKHGPVGCRSSNTRQSGLHLSRHGAPKFSPILRKSAGERNVDLSVGFGVTRNTYSAHSKFSENTQAEKVVDRTGKPVGENSCNAQIRTLLDEQRQIIIAENCEKVSHHELQTARAEQERQILQEELWRQQQDFREVHQQSLTEMEESREFQSSTFDTLARRKLIEDQNTIMELSGRLQELQNEVNCMNDSKDFQDAESVRSGNSHVTSQPVSFPPHPIPE